MAKTAPDPAAAPDPDPEAAPAADFAIRPEGDALIIAQVSFKAAPEALHRALTDPEQVRQWMGAPEMPLQVCEVDARPGGRFRMSWTFPDGGTSWLAGTFSEIAPERLAHVEMVRPDWTGGEVQVLRQIRAHEGRTWLRQTSRYRDALMRGQVLGAAGPGLRASWTRLAVLLGSKAEKPEKEASAG